MTLRLFTALIATVVVAAASPTAASAFVFITFTTMPDVPARIDAIDFENEAPLRVELVRGGAVIASGDMSVEAPAFQPGDTVKALSGQTLLASATYDGTPAFGDVCLGSTTFTVTRPPAALQFDAGAGALLDEASPPIESTTSDASPAVVTLSRPLAAGDAAFASALGEIDGGVLGVLQAVNARDCSTPRPPDRGPTPDDPGAPQGERPHAAPLSAAPAVARLKRLGLARLARGRTHVFPITLTQPGTVRLKLLARGKVIGTGKKTAGSGPQRVTVRLSAAGRKLLRRSTRLKLTLVATLTPSRAGEAPQRASVSVTLRR